MPRETIKIYDGSYDVKVGWTADREMQIGIDEAEGRSLFWILLENNAEWIGSEVRRIVAEANEPGTKPLGDLTIGKEVLNMLDSSTHGPVSSVWATPNRYQVNQLIKVLRRARDSAFGKDE